MFSGIKNKAEAWRRAWQFSLVISLTTSAAVALVSTVLWGPALGLPAALVALVVPSSVLPWMTFHAVDSKRRLNETLSTLETMTKMDSTTRLLNRAGFMESGRALFDKLKASGEPLSAVLIDVDHLDNINRAHGYDCGDAVLAQVAELLSMNIQPGVDLAARYGGAAFVLLLPQAEHAWASAFAERLRGTFANRAVRHADAYVNVSASFGVAALQPGDTGPDDLIARASEALRDAKSGGRNKVHVRHEAARALAA